MDLHLYRRPARPVPGWLITDDYDDEVVGSLKTGKEAEVFVVERTAHDGSRTCLLAHKRYRPTRVTKGELEASGFARARSFTNDTIYHEGRRFKRSRDQRAVARMTGHGKQMLNDRWPEHEITMIARLWAAGADVPYPIEFVDDGMLTEYIGDARQAAPRLVHARLGPVELRAAVDQIVDNLRTFTEEGIVHADLSPFNVLWWDDQVWIIDLPQAVDLVLNPHGLDLLHRDVTTMARWFARGGVECDPDALFAELLTCWTG